MVPRAISACSAGDGASSDGRMIVNIDIKKISDGQLADWFFSNLDFDPEIETEQTQQLDAEVMRRGLTMNELGDAQDAMAFDVVPEERLKAEMEDDAPAN